MTICFYYNSPTIETPSRFGFFERTNIMTRARRLVFSAIRRESSPFGSLSCVETPAISVTTRPASSGSIPNFSFRPPPRRRYPVHDNVVVVVVRFATRTVIILLRIIYNVLIHKYCCTYNTTGRPAHIRL